jgi:hypothetical protein
MTIVKGYRFKKSNQAKTVKIQKTMKTMFHKNDSLV